MAKCKLTPETSKVILGFIAQGSTEKIACQAAGIDESTLTRWKQDGKAAKSGKFHIFYMALKRARAAAFQSNLNEIRRAATEKQVLKTIKVTHHPDGTKTTVEEYKETPRQWQAAAWLLERKYPADFGRNRTQDTGEDNQPLPWTGDDDHDADIGKLMSELEEMTAKKNAELEMDGGLKCQE